MGNITGALSTLRPGGTEAFRDAQLRETFATTHSNCSRRFEAAARRRKTGGSRCMPPLNKYVAPFSLVGAADAVGTPGETRPS